MPLRRLVSLVTAIGLGSLGLGACGSSPAAPTPASSSSAESSPSPSSSAPATPSAPPSPTTPAARSLFGAEPVLAVKIDNTSAARPRIGLSAADVVYVEPVEGGLTRLLAVYTRTQPPAVGPIRSARESDAVILANYGPVAFAYSGGSAYTLSALRTGPQVNLSFDASAQGFRRDASRPAPYNVIGAPAALLARAGGSVPAGDVGFHVAPPPAGGTAAAGVRTAYAAARVEARWDASRAQYLITTDGRPEISDGQSVGAATVIVQTVAPRPSPNRDVNGQPTPVVEVVGSGPVEVHRGGLRYAGTWRRESPSAPTVFAAADGTPLTVAEGPVWVLLVPSGQGVGGL